MAKQQSATAPAEAWAEVKYLSDKNTFGVPITELPSQSGDHVLKATDSFTSDMLPGKTLQPKQLQMKDLSGSYPPHQQDETSDPPYKANDLGNFRFQYFNNELYLWGHHTWQVADYAALHGFNVIRGSEDQRTPNGQVQDTKDMTSPANLPPGMTWKDAMPAGTKWMRVIEVDGHIDDLHSVLVSKELDGLINWGNYMDLDMNNVKKAIREQIIERTPKPTTQWDPTQWDQLMLDIEKKGLLSPDKLSKTGWYPYTAGKQAQKNFEDKYYNGYARVLILIVEAAREVGYKNISIYSEQPVPGFEELVHQNKYIVDKWAERIFLQILPLVDIVNPGPFCPAWLPAEPDNVAFTLAHSDLSLKYLKAKNSPRPLRQYFWYQFFGNSGDIDKEGNPWYGLQALPMEDMRAMACLNAFTQYDGMVLYGWTGSVNHNKPPEFADMKIAFDGVTDDEYQKGGFNIHNFLFKHDFNATSFAPLIWPYDRRKEQTLISRYEAMHITYVNKTNNKVQLQHIYKLGTKNWPMPVGFNTDIYKSLAALPAALPETARMLDQWDFFDPYKPTCQPFYECEWDKIKHHLLLPFAALAGLFEGMAMAKLLEWNLRHGTKVVDKGNVLEDDGKGNYLSTGCSFDSLQTIKNHLPIVRHIKNNDLHIVATYDPRSIYVDKEYKKPARAVKLTDFGGVKGLNLTLNTDEQVRIYIIRIV